MNEISNDKKILIGCLAGSFLIYNGILKLKSYLRTTEWVPVGIVKSLHVYPIKSCSPIDVFSFKCTEMGPKIKELEDRTFLIVDGETGKFYTARQKPALVKVKCHVESGILTVSAEGKPSVDVDLKEIISHGSIIRATLFDNLQQDGYDCGDQVSQFFSEYIQESNVRLIYYQDGLYTERTTIPESDWWNNPVPQRTDDSAYNDFAPFLIITDASLQDLNSRLDKKVTSRNFRPSIQVEECDAWDEDRWAELKIGDAVLECFAPCTRCVLTTVDPAEGVMHKNVQPLKTLREFRLAPEGKMRNFHKESPIFGVYAGMKHPGYIHIGQTVYARYKSSPF